MLVGPLLLFNLSFIFGYPDNLVRWECRAKWSLLNDHSLRLASPSWHTLSGDPLQEALGSQIHWFTRRGIRRTTPRGFCCVCVLYAGLGTLPRQQQVLIFAGLLWEERNNSGILWAPLSHLPAGTCGDLASAPSGACTLRPQNSGTNEEWHRQDLSHRSGGPSRCRINKSTAKHERQTSSLSLCFMGQEWEGAPGPCRSPWEIMNKLWNTGNVVIDLTGFGFFLWSILAFMG